MIWVFGDSWAAGYGLKEKEKRFSDHFEGEVINKGISASSMGHVTADVLKQSPEFKEGDSLVVIIPPDTRWYNIQRDYQTSSIFNDCPEQLSILEIHSYREWYVYHHSLFIYTLINLAKDKGMRLVLAHNYGKLEIAPFFDIPDSVFLDRKKSLTHLLLGTEVWVDNLRVADKNRMNNVQHDYFIPGDNHPNELGHKIIADMIIAKLRSL